MARSTSPSDTPEFQAALVEVLPHLRAFARYLTRRREQGDDHREGLILVGASGLSYEEAAEICGCAVGTIKSRVSRARSELIKILSEDRLKVSRAESAAVSGMDAGNLLDPAVPGRSE